ncbi:hypothetical protein [Moraxella lacunata]
MMTLLHKATPKHHCVYGNFKVYWVYIFKLKEYRWSGADVR